MPLSFMRNVRAPEFASGLDWIGAESPPRLADLAGRFALLDFWTSG
jgi:hypothetical protein